MIGHPRVVIGVIVHDLAKRRRLASPSASKAGRYAHVPLVVGDFGDHVAQCPVGEYRCLLLGHQAEKSIGTC
jgi:hypothetical protein